MKKIMLVFGISGLLGGVFLADAVAGNAPSDGNCGGNYPTGGSFSCYWKQGGSTANCFNISAVNCTAGGGTMKTNDAGKSYCQIPYDNKPC